MSILSRIGGGEIDRFIGLAFPKVKRGIEDVENEIRRVIPSELLPRALRNPSASLQEVKERTEIDPNIYPIINYAIHNTLRRARSFHTGVIKRIGDDNGASLLDDPANAVDKLIDPLLSKINIKLPPDATKALRNLNNIIEDPVSGTLNAIGEYQAELTRATDWALKKFGYEGGVQGLMGAAQEEVAKNESLSRMLDNVSDVLPEEVQKLNPWKQSRDTNKGEWINYPGFTTFKGYNSVKGLEVWTSNLWDIEIEPYYHNGSGPPPPPYSQNGNNFLPITSFEFMDSSLNPMAVELFGGSSILIPESENFQRSIRLNVLDVLQNGERVWKKYFSDYKKHMVNDYKVRPYKNCCTKITIHMYNTSMRRIHYKTYLGILMTPDTSFSGSSFGNEEYTIEYAIVGELGLTNARNFWETGGGKQK